MSAVAEQAPRTARELASRSGDGLVVVLTWDPATDEVTVSVDDLRSGGRIDIPVPGDQALDAFNHPFAYAEASR